MKKSLFIALCALFCSCTASYDFVQVMKTSVAGSSKNVSMQKGSLVYDDTDCRVYYNLWAEGGDASFEFYNKTDHILYVDLTKSFLIRNGLSQTYFQNREWSESHSSAAVETITRSSMLSNDLTTGSAHVTAYQPATVSISANQSTSSFTFKTAATTAVSSAKGAGISWKENPLVAIPPKASVRIGEFSLNKIIYKDCDFNRWPSDSASVQFTQENTPLQITNYITYNAGDGTADKEIQTSFYVSEIVNYAEPAALVFVKQETPCENLLNQPLNSTSYSNYSSSSSNGYYDAYWRVEEPGAFYNNYRTWSGTKLYKKQFVWNTTYKAYYKQGVGKSDWQVVVPTKDNK